MFNKKVLLAALVMASVSGLVACDNTTPTPVPSTPEVESTPVVDDEFVQNTDTSQFEAASMYVVGSHWNSWTPATIQEAEGCAFTASATIPNCLEIDIVVTQEMIDAWCGFKFIAGPSWNTQYGMEDIDYTRSNDAFKNQYKNEDGSVKEKTSWAEGTGNRSNVEAKLPGTFHIEYYPLNFDSVSLPNGNTHSNKFVVTFTPEA